MRMMGADSAAQKPVAVEHAQFGNVARVIADVDRFADIGCKCGIGVEQALKPNAVTADLPGF